MHIRQSNNQDTQAIQQVHLAAFPPEERETIAKLSADLLTGQSHPETLSLVAELNGAIVGNIIFSPVSINSSEQIKAYILSPLGVIPAAQKHGVGSGLIKAGLQQLEDMGAHLVFVYGDPAYYSKFGFTPEAALGYAAPYKLQFPFGWQAMAPRDNGGAQGPMVVRCVPALSNPALW